MSDDLPLGRPGHFLEPPIRELGHVEWFQECWLLRRLDGSPSRLPGSDSIYDSFRVSYKLRWSHVYPSRGETETYLSDVLARVLDREPDPYFTTLAALHEDMHAENLTLALQTLGYPRPAFPRAGPSLDETHVPHDASVPGGTVQIGASPDEPFVFDNEKWAHPVDVAPFRIASTPVTNAEFAAFVDDDGYRRREFWSRAGWEWRRSEGAEHPIFWISDHERYFDTVAPRRPWHPVAGVNWYEQSDAGISRTPGRL